MADFLIRGLHKTMLARLKARAARHGRSLQGEAKMILERAARTEKTESVLRELREFRSAGGGRFRDSTGMIREDRER